MKSFEVNDILNGAKKAGDRYHEFLRVPDISVGVYLLKAGEIDPQNPHQQDEVYYVLSGRAKFQLGEEIQDVAAGSILYVEAQQSHKFLEIVEDLQILVFFAPAEDS